MNDRGFKLDDDLPEGVSLNIQPFMRGKSQLSMQEETETRRIASVRVHVERAIERVKIYRILQSVFQLTLNFSSYSVNTVVSLSLPHAQAFILGFIKFSGKHFSNIDFGNMFLRL